MTGVYADELTRHVALAPGDVWAAIDDTAAYRRWWPWLATFDAAGGLVQGATWRAAIRAPLPYTVGFALDFTTVDADARVVRSAVTGDVTGDAEVRLGTDGGGTELTMSWRLVPARALLRRLDATARPLARWGHDVVMRRSVDAFVRAVEHRS